MRLKYNAPVTLTLSFIAAALLVLDQTVVPGIIRNSFCTPGKYTFTLTGPFDFFRLFSHIFGHADWNHLLSNFSYILLLGPILEENFGSWSMALMIFITALATGVLNVLLFSSALMGASGIVFMMILLASVTNINRNEIPLTFILIVVLYLGREVRHMFTMNNISEFAHLAGGFCGSIFGFMNTGSSAGGKKKREKPAVKIPEQKKRGTPPGSDIDVDITEFMPGKK